MTLKNKAIPAHLKFRNILVPDLLLRLALVACQRLIRCLQKSSKGDENCICGLKLLVNTLQHNIHGEYSMTLQTMLPEDKCLKDRIQSTDILCMYMVNIFLAHYVHVCMHVWWKLSYNTTCSHLFRRQTNSLAIRKGILQVTLSPRGWLCCWVPRQNDSTCAPQNFCLLSQGGEAAGDSYTRRCPLQTAAPQERLKRGRQRFVAPCEVLLCFKTNDLSHAGAPSAVLFVFRTIKREKPLRCRLPLAAEEGREAFNTFPAYPTFSFLLLCANSVCWPHY